MFFVLGMNMPVYGQEVHNDCLSYFYLYTARDTNHYKFSEVIKRTYHSSDSLIKEKYLVYKSVITFNKNGNELSLLEKTDLGHTTDSITKKYDANFNMVRDVRWEAGDTSRLEKEQEEMWTYDKDNNELTDTSYEFFVYDASARIKIFKYEYDNKDNETKSWERDEEGGDIDTTVYWFGYNNDKKVTFRKELRNKIVSKEYYTYNSKGEEVFYAETEGKDSIWTVTKYDNMGNETEWNRYKNGKLVRAYTMRFGENKTKIETTEEVSTADPFSCPNNSIKVTVSDSTGRHLSEVTTREYDGKPIVTTIIDKYYKYQTLGIYGSVRKQFIDSTFGIEQGFMYYEKWKEVYILKFDQRGNLVERLIQHGNDTYPKEEKDIRRYNRMNNETYSARFGSCNANIPDVETVSIYYPNGKSIKEVKEITGGIMQSDTYYDKQGRMERKIIKNPDLINGGKSFTYITYEYK